MREKSKECRFQGTGNDGWNRKQQLVWSIFPDKNVSRGRTATVAESGSTPALPKIQKSSNNGRNVCTCRHLRAICHLFCFCRHSEYEQVHARRPGSAVDPVWKFVKKTKELWLAMLGLLHQVCVEGYVQDRLRSRVVWGKLKALKTPSHTPCVWLPKQKFWEECWYQSLLQLSIEAFLPFPELQNKILPKHGYVVLG